MHARGDFSSRRALQAQLQAQQAKSSKQTLQCITVLPSLTLESLLIKEEAEGDDSDFVPEKIEDPRAERARQACRRLYTHRNLTDTGVFVDNITLPPLQCARSSPITPRRSSSPREQDDSTKFSPKEWHLVMCKESDSCRVHTVDYIVHMLVALLGVDDATARERTDMLRTGASLLTFDSKSEALGVAQQLRDKGIMVRVTAAPNKDASPHARSSRIDYYAERFRGTLQGDLFRLARSVQSQQGQQMNIAAGANWRIYSDMKLVPEDPVESFFEWEKRQQVDGVAAWEDLCSDVSEPASQMLIDMSMPTRKRTVVEARPKCNEEKVAGDDSPQRSTRKRRASVKRRTSAIMGQSNSAKANIIDTMPRQQLKKLKEHCRLARIWAFGHVNGTGPDDSPEEMDGALEAAAREIIGEKDIVQQLYNQWVKLDDDNSGRIDFKEFREYCKSLAHRGLTELAAVAEELHKALFGKKSSFTIDDMMKLLWPSTTPTEISTMKSWFKEFQLDAMRTKVAAPMALPAHEFEGLLAVFDTHDKTGEGTIHIDQLIKAGVVQQAQLQEFKRRFDSDNSGVIDASTFCQLMCPAGYRTTIFQLVGTAPDGRRVCFNEVDQTWRLDESEEVFADGEVLE